MPNAAMTKGNPSRKRGRVPADEHAIEDHCGGERAIELWTEPCRYCQTMTECECDKCGDVVCAEHVKLHRADCEA